MKAKEVARRRWRGRTNSISGFQGSNKSRVSIEAQENNLALGVVFLVCRKGLRRGRAPGLAGTPCRCGCGGSGRRGASVEGQLQPGAVWSSDSGFNVARRRRRGGGGGGEAMCVLKIWRIGCRQKGECAPTMMESWARGTYKPREWDVAMAKTQGSS